MATKPDNPPAFPDAGYRPVKPGMTLRDWFAGQALANMTGDYTLPSQPAVEAYAIADAMLVARAKGGDA